MELTGTVRERRTIVVHVTDKTPAVVALDLSPLPLDPPVVDGLEKGYKLVLLLEPDLGGVHP